MFWFVEILPRPLQGDGIASKKKSRRYDITVISPHDLLTDEKLCRAWIKRLEKQLKLAQKALRRIIKKN